MTIKFQASKYLRFLLAIVASPAIQLTEAHAYEYDIGNAIYFAAGWRMRADIDQNTVQLGVVFRCGREGWCLERETFAGSKNLGLKPIPANHQMRSPKRSPTCTDGPINSVKGDVDNVKNVRFTVTADGWKLETDDMQYIWRNVSGNYASPRFELIKVLALGTSVSIGQVVGVAYAAKEASSLSSLEPMKRRYEGTIHHKDMNAKVTDQWDTTRSIINFGAYIPTDANAAVWSLTLPGHRDVIKRLRKELWVANGLAIAPSRAPHLTYVVHEYGHDFNSNGCVDEPGHNKMMLPVLVDGQVVALPYVEYTPDRKDGVPMLSVGSYYQLVGQRPAKK